MQTPRILVIDPDSDVRWLFADLVQRRGYEVSTFADDEDALAFVRCRGLAPWLLVDLRLPPPGAHLRHRWLSRLMAELDEHAPRVVRGLPQP